MSESLGPPGPTTASSVHADTVAEVYGRAYLHVERSGGQHGAAFLDYELEDGTSYSEDAADYFAGPESWFDADVLACEQVRGRTLDLGCGVGRHALELMAAGHEVVGLENSPEAVAVARRRGVDPRQGDLFDPPRGLGSFDTLLLLGINFALVCNSPNHAAAFRRLAAIANPGAQLLGSDMRAPIPQQSPRLRVRFRSGAERSEWSSWQGGKPWTPPERLSDLVDGTGWHVADIQEASNSDNTFLTVLRLAD